MASHESIFVSIINYRDAECQKTLHDLFEKAAFPSLVHIGLVNQLHPDEDADLFRFDAHPFASHVRVQTLPHTAARGPCYARYLAQQMYNQETFFLQIDCHMRFDQDWDTQLKHFWKCCYDPRAILSTYPPDYEHGEMSQPNAPVLLCADKFDKHKMLRLTGKRLIEKQTQPIPCKFVAAGFLFGSGSIIRDVPYDPQLLCLFFGEEISLALRLWTHGYNFFAPPRNIVYHRWSRAHRPNWREILTPELLELEKKSRIRVHFLCGLVETTPNDAQIVNDLHKYGLGSQRSRQQFEQCVGINFKNQIVDDKYGGQAQLYFEESKKK